MDPSKSEKAFFKAAKNISTLSDHPIQKLGCVVVDKHRIISSGHNSHSKCHAIQAKLDKETFNMECRGCLHAESSALIPLIKQGYVFNKASIFVYREHANGMRGMARPCSRCMKIIKECGIKNIYYTTEDGYARERLVY